MGAWGMDPRVKPEDDVEVERTGGDIAKCRFRCAILPF
ncbi:hypothetical protein L901_17060 [Agrobacterium sp. D14]|nr:hypothetical protein L901_17060 [Agrobacterium sp. D14]